MIGPQHSIITLLTVWYTVFFFFYFVSFIDSFIIRAA